MTACYLINLISGNTSGDCFLSNKWPPDYLKIQRFKKLQVKILSCYKDEI